jgi:protein tyrosine phosphatase (PTP) superfamily phosphohydrolase (DUF442 family)
MLPSIKAFTTFTDRLSTAGQPPAEAFPALRSAGFERVINLGLLDQPYSLPDERTSVEAAGMAYCHIPVPFDAPAPEHFAAFLAEMDSAPGAKVFLHCAANYRASSFAALYGVHRLGWDHAQAEALLARIWIPNPVWRAFLDAQFQAAAGR